MGGGTSKPQPQIRTYKAGELSEVTESTDGSTSNALLREKSNYAVTGGTTSKQPQKHSGRTVQIVDPDSPGHLSEAASIPSESPGGTWQDPTAGFTSPTGFISPKTDAATSPTGMPALMQPRLCRCTTSTASMRCQNLTAGGRAWRAASRARS